MAGVERAALSTRVQLRAIAQVRRQLLVNSLRTVTGTLEAISRVISGLVFTGLGFGGAVGFAVGGWWALGRGHWAVLAALLWGLFVFWQVFPLASSTFSEQVDVSHLARFPLSFRAYCLVRVAFGAVDVATLVGGLCCLGLAIGLLVARPELVGWIVVGVTLYAAFNLLLSQMIFAWLERWLARRKTRELLTVLFFVVIIAVQFIGPAVNYMDHHRAAASATASQAMVWLHFADWLPPSLPLRALRFAGDGAWGMAMAAVAALAVWSVVVLRLLNLRLVREYRGEVWSESAAPTRRRKTASAEVTARLRWWDRLPGWGGAAGTIAEKELRYLLRSPAMYFALAMPVVLMLILQAQGLGGGHRHGLALSGFGFPVGVAYTLLALTNLSFNQFGNDGVGAQLYFVAPVAFRTVLRGKNLALGTLIALEIVVVFIAAALVDRPPALALAAATVVGMAFASLCTFAAGNMISLTFPRKVDFSRMGKQGLRGVGSMVALAVEGGAVAIAGLAAVAGILLHRPWLGVGLELVLTAAAIVVYQYLLGPAEHLAGRQREALLAELSKA